MALVQVNFISQSLKRTVSMNVILPVDKFLFKGNCQPVKEYKTLYLLHGLLGNYTDWVTRTRIQEWAEAKNLVVVMPSGDNSFYVDQEVKNNDFGIFIGTELIEVTIPSFIFIFTCPKTLYLCGFSPFSIFLLHPFYTLFSTVGVAASNC